MGGFRRLANFATVYFRCGGLKYFLSVISRFADLNTDMTWEIVIVRRQSLCTTTSFSKVLIRAERRTLPYHVAGCDGRRPGAGRRRTRRTFAGFRRRGRARMAAGVKVLMNKLRDAVLGGWLFRFPSVMRDAMLVRFSTGIVSVGTTEIFVGNLRLYG